MSALWLRLFRRTPPREPHACPVCRGPRLKERPVLWPELIAAWGLSPEEAAMIDRQQGLTCAECQAQLRIMTLADGILRHFRWPGDFRSFCAGPLRRRRVLEVNAAGALHTLLRSLPQHTFATFPEVDLQALPYPDSSFELIVHSDTLEHVPDPLQALRECRRVLVPEGLLAYTVPIVPGRLSRRRDGLPPSYHGRSGDERQDYLVVSEYGADCWTELMQAGFTRVTLHTREFPASFALLAER